MILDFLTCGACDRYQLCGDNDNNDDNADDDDKNVDLDKRERERESECGGQLGFARAH